MRIFSVRRFGVFLIIWPHPAVANCLPHCVQLRHEQYPRMTIPNGEEAPFPISVTTYPQTRRHTTAPLLLLRYVHVTRTMLHPWMIIIKLECQITHCSRKKTLLQIHLQTEGTLTPKSLVRSSDEMEKAVCYGRAYSMLIWISRCVLFFFDSERCICALC